MQQVLQLPRTRRGVSKVAVTLAGACALGGALLLTPQAAGASEHHSFGRQSTVYTETNQASGNQVLAYRALPNGALDLLGSFATDGTGTGASPNSQGAVTLGDHGRLLAAVNGGSNDVSVFRVQHDGSLRLLGTVPSGGIDPISATIHGAVVYSLNAGTNTVAANLGGASLFGWGHAWSQSLSSGALDPEEVAASPDGRTLVVTEKGSDSIDTFRISHHGAIGQAVTTKVTTNTGPYGFSFLRDGDLVVSEAAYGGLATFSLNRDGTLTQLSQVPDGQLAPCWTALAFGGREVFTTNAHSGNISAYWIGKGDVLTLITPEVQATTPTAGDTDLAVASNGFLYTSVQPVVTASSVLSAGGLGTTTTVASGFPTGTFGLAAS